jgi:hypothetical protein
LNLAAPTDQHTSQEDNQRETMQFRRGQPREIEATARDEKTIEFNYAHPKIMC